MNAAALAAFSAQLQSAMEATFPATITIGGHTIPCARCGSTRTASPELAGLFSECDVVYRIALANIPVGVVFTPQNTRLAENGKNYRVEKIQEPNSSATLIVGCKAA